MARLAFGVNSTKACAASLLTLLPVFLTGCANSCVSGFWNPPNTTVGVAISNPPPACKLPTPKGTIQIVVQVSDSCESCSASNRVHTVVLNLGGIELHTSADAAGEPSAWQTVLPEPGKQSSQVQSLSGNMNALASESADELPIPAGSYDLVRLRLARNQTRGDDKHLFVKRVRRGGTQLRDHAGWSICARGV